MAESDYRLLIVDNGVIASMMGSRNMTAFDDVAIKLVHSVEEALEVLEAFHFDAIVSCGYLGNADLKGIDLLQWIRHSGSRIPFFLITDETDKELAIRASTLDAKVFLRRDIEEYEDVFIELVSCVRDEMRTKNGFDVNLANAIDFRSLFDSSLDGILATDLKGVFIQCNPRFSEMIDTPMSEIIGSDFTKIVAPDYWGIAQQIGLQVQRIGQSEPMEIALLSSNGARIPVIISSWRRDNADGLSIGAWVWIHDLSEQKEVEARGDWSELKFRSIFEDSPIAIAIADKDGRLLEMNKECISLFGVSDFETIRGYEMIDDPYLLDEHKERLVSGVTVDFFINYSFDKIIEDNVYETSRRGVVRLKVFAGPLFKKDSVGIDGYIFQLLEQSLE